VPEWGSEIPVLGVRDIPEPATTITSTITTRAEVGERGEMALGARGVGTVVMEKKREKRIIRDLDKFYASESESEEDEEEEEEESEEEDEEVSDVEEDQEEEEETDEESEDDNTERLPLNREWS